MLVTLKDFRDAHHRILSDIVRTPLITIRPLPALPPITFKLELFQHTGSFKVRGVLNKLATLDPEQTAAGVISMSSGNHAQAVAYGAQRLGVSATLIMPDWSSPSKVAATRSYGAETILTADNLIEVCRHRQREKGLTMVHPFDDPAIIAGAGTLGLEIADDYGEPDLVLVSVGGGGLISGVAGALKQSFPSCRVVGIEPVGADVMTQSLKAGKPVHAAVNTIADGLAAPFVGEHTLAHVREFVDSVITVSDEEILAALRFLIEHCRIWVEPAAAAAFSPLLNQRIEVGDARRIVCIMCGANMDLDRLHRLLWGENQA